MGLACNAHEHGVSPKSTRCFTRRDRACPLPAARCDLDNLNLKQVRVLVARRLGLADDGT